MNNVKDDDEWFLFSGDALLQERLYDSNEYPIATMGIPQVDYDIYIVYTYRYILFTSVSWKNNGDIQLLMDPSYAAGIAGVQES